GGAQSQVGGLVGTNGDANDPPGTIETSYSTGAVAGGKRSNVGGFAGIAYKARKYDAIRQSYWDTTTSGTDRGTGKGDRKGIAGLTTEQLQSGLPDGFDPKIWAENPKINNGLPYLINNPPEK
ncbi:MAG TPA: GLUG motif-containing protein, partial [Rhizomicrobium sp.]|nr:GLUG motif-containing protein [Rhizomicrobium sp.]